MNGRWCGRRGREVVRWLVAPTVVWLALLSVAGAQEEGTAQGTREAPVKAQTREEIARELVRLVVWTMAACTGLLLVSVYYASRRMRRQLKAGRRRSKPTDMTDIWFENPIERGGPSGGDSSSEEQADA